MCVLLVEDEVHLRSCLAEMMIEAGFDVVQAGDAESALFLAETMKPFELIVSDVNLGPGMNGLNLRDAARRRWPEIPVLLMSGVEANFAGSYFGDTERFLSKPFSFEVFLQMIADLVGCSRSLPA